MSYVWLVKNDIFLSLLVLALFVYICVSLVEYIKAKKTNSKITATNYLFGILKG
jgi:hypothetical protein